MKFFWFASSLGAICGFLVLLVGYSSARSAPQEAAVAAMAVAAAIVPYVFARSIQLFGQAERDERRHAEILAVLKPSAASSGHEQSQPAAGIGSSSPVPQAPPLTRTN